MSTCPRCGMPLDPDAARCLACVHGEPRLNPAFRRNPTSGWALRGAAVGAILGACAGLVGLVANVLAGEDPDVVLPGAAALAGGLLGALALLFWKSLVRPILLALFASETFEREYGTPEEQGIVRRTKP